MSTSLYIETLRADKVVPVVVIEDPSKALPLAEALVSERTEQPESEARRYSDEHHRQGGPFFVGESRRQYAEFVCARRCLSEPRA